MKLFVLCALVLAQQTLAIRFNTSPLPWSRELCEFKVEKFFDQKLDSGMTSFQNIRTLALTAPELSFCFDQFSRLLIEFMDRNMEDYVSNYVSSQHQHRIDCTNAVKSALQMYKTVDDLPAFTTPSWDQEISKMQTEISESSDQVTTCFMDRQIRDILRQKVFAIIDDVATLELCKLKLQRFFQDKLELGATNFYAIESQALTSSDLAKCFGRFSSELTTFMNVDMVLYVRQFLTARRQKQPSMCLSTVDQVLDRTFPDYESLPSFRSPLWVDSITRVENVISQTSRLINNCFANTQIREILRQKIFSVSYDLTISRDPLGNWMN